MIDGPMIRIDTFLGAEIDGGMVLMSPQSNAYVCLNRTATVIWSLLEVSQAAGDIATALVQRFEVDQRTALAATRKTLDLLTREKLVTAAAGHADT